MPQQTITKRRADVGNLLRANRHRAIVIAILAVAAIGVCAWTWAGVPVSRVTVGSVIVGGLATGAIYAVSASGLVLTYSTTGVFNFAHGAIGMYWAFAYWELRERGMPAGLAAALVILVLAPIGGVLLDQILFQRLKNVRLIVQLMVTLGLMIAIIGFADTQWKPDQPRFLTPAVGNGGFDIPMLGVFVTWQRLLTICVAVVIAIGLRLLLYKSRHGVAMRAVVDSPALVALNGANPAALERIAWALGSSLAALAGILIAAQTNLHVIVLSFLVIDAVAAAAVGRLRSIPWTVAGAVLIGLGQQFMSQFLSFSDGFTNAPKALPAIVLFGLLILLPEVGIHHKVHTPTHLRPPLRLTTTRDATLGATVILAIALIWSNGWFPGLDLWSPAGFENGITTMVSAIILLSLVPLTGWAGQVWFAPMTFAGIGAVAYIHLSGSNGFVGGLLVCAAIAGICGAALAIPTMKLSGLYLALSSMALARIFELLVFTQSSLIAPPSEGTQFVPFRFFDLTLERNGQAFFVALTILFCAAMVGVATLRRSKIGRRLAAIRDSQAAAAAAGINVTKVKLLAFGLSAAIAGLGGALLGVQQTIVVSENFGLFAGIPLILILVWGGVSLPVAALLGSFQTTLFIVTQETFEIPVLSSLSILAPGIFVMILITNPNGMGTRVGGRLARFLPWRPDARANFQANIDAHRVFDPGPLGLNEPFTAAAVVEIDHALGVVGAATPAGGYHNSFGTSTDPDSAAADIGLSEPSLPISTTTSAAAPPATSTATPTTTTPPTSSTKTQA